MLSRQKTGVSVSWGGYIFVRNVQQICGGKKGLLSAHQVHSEGNYHTALGAVAALGAVCLRPYFCLCHWHFATSIGRAQALSLALSMDSSTCHSAEANKLRIYFRIGRGAACTPSKRPAAADDSRVASNSALRRPQERRGDEHQHAAGCQFRAGVEPRVISQYVMQYE